MIKMFFSALFSLFALLSIAQTTSSQYIFRVYLKDKGAVNYSVDKPSEFLSQTAIERKLRQKAAIDSTDFPISPNYFVQLQQLDGLIVAHSKWFKTISVKLDDSLQVERIAALPFVDSVKYVWRGKLRTDILPTRPRLEMPDCFEKGKSDDYFGFTALEFSTHNAQYMAESGFRGKGINIAVIDAGFANADVIPYFNHSNIVGSRDFVPSGHLYTASDHGTKVLSTMAVNQPGIMIGSAAEASYLLFRSEDALSEFPVEEDYWVCAIECADSLGVDLVNTSLGYNNFDDASLSYTRRQTNGITSFMSRAADRAYRKGMVVVCSAGNEGSKPWRKITSPGDAWNVITVGAIGTDSVIASFSSKGPTADLRIKPDLVSIGRNTFTVGQNGKIGMTNGTSLSSPFLAGLVASLWSVNPELHRSKLLDIVRETGDRFNEPDTVYGYGIPDFKKALRNVLYTLPEYRKNVSDSICEILPKSDVYEILLQNPKLPTNFYAAKLLDENGIFISAHSFGMQNNLQIPFSKEQKKKNKTLFFVIENPVEQRVYRIKL